MFSKVTIFVSINKLDGFVFNPSEGKDDKNYEKKF